MFLKQLMQAPQPGSRGAQFGSAMGEMAPLLFSMAQGLRSGQGASAYAPQGLAAMMYQQQLADEKADKQRKEREAKASQAAAERMVAESLGMFGGGGGYGSPPGAVSQNAAMAAGGGPSLDAAELVTGSPEWLNYANSGATRNRPLNPKLVNALGFLPEMGIGVEVFSGGQPAEGQNRVGSRRHDHGLAADVFFTKDGRRLDWRNEADIPVLQSIVQRAKANGVTGFGAGEGYMQPGSMHIGFGTPAVWGADGKGANAPEWLRAAYDGSAGTMSAKGTPASAPTQQRRISPERAAQILANPNVPAAVKNMVAAQFMPQEQEKPQIVKGADGYNYWVAPGQPPQRVVPGIEAPEQGPEYGFNDGYFYDKNNPQSGATQIPGMPPQSPLVQMDPAPPKGYRNVYEGGRLVRQEPIPGGPEDTSAMDAAKNSAAATSSDVIVNAARRASSAAEERLLTGALGALASINPANQNAEVYRQVKVLTSTGTIESLNEMRRQSPTGGALGNVTEGEGKMLAAKAGALDPASPNFQRDLEDYTRTLLRTIHGIEAGDAMFAEVWPTRGLRGVTNVADGPAAGYGRGGAMAANAASPADIQGGDGQPISLEAMQILRDNPTPEYKAFFDEVFGPGSADRVLGQ